MKRNFSPVSNETIRMLPVWILFIFLILTGCKGKSDKGKNPSETAKAATETATQSSAQDEQALTGCTVIVLLSQIFLAHAFLLKT